MSERASVYETVTASILAELEKGSVPWVKPWQAGMPLGLPYNALSQREYRGVNVLLLWGAGVFAGYRNPAWLTFRQARGLGGFVRRGEKATWIVYAGTVLRKRVDPDTGEDTEEKRPFLKGYAVFNIEQTEGLPERLSQVAERKPVGETREGVERFIRGIGADVRHGGSRAYYEPQHDFIRLPEPSTFASIESYYATSLHEHGHWTGHERRLHRDFSGRFGSAAYAAEELVAELTAAFLCAHLGIPGELRHAGYIGSWLTLLTEDKRAIFTAARKASEAADYLRAFTEPVAVPTEEEADHADSALR